MALASHSILNQVFAFYDFNKVSTDVISRWQHLRIDSSTTCATTVPSFVQWQLQDCSRRHGITWGVERDAANACDTFWWAGGIVFSESSFEQLMPCISEQLTINTAGGRHREWFSSGKKNTRIKRCGKMPCTPWIGNGGCINMISKCMCARQLLFSIMAVIDRERGRSPRQFHLQTLKPLFLSRQVSLEKPSSIQRARVSHYFFFNNFSQQVPDCWHLWPTVYIHIK